MANSQGDKKVTNSDAFEWDERKTKAAVSLARGLTFEAAAKAAGVTRKTVHEWNKHVEFSDEVDHLTLLVGYAQKVERLRIANRIIDELLARPRPTNKDLLDWMKFAQSETDGAKFDLTALTDVFEKGESDTSSNGSTGSANATG